MTGAEYSTAIAKLGLSQVDSAKFLKVGDRTVRHWIAEDGRIPYAVAMMLRLMLKMELSTALVEKLTQG